MEEYIGSCMFHLSNEDKTGVLQMEKEVPIQHSAEKQGELWQMYFDGSSSKGEKDRIVLISPRGEIIWLCTNWNCKQLTIQ